MVGFIGMILTVALFFSGACAAVVPSLPAEKANLSGNRSSPAVLLENETSLLLEPVSDDERLESLIAGAGVPLLSASVDLVCFLYTHDDAALRVRAADMAFLVDGYRAGAAALDISSDMEPAYGHFIAALDEFALACTSVSEGIPLNRSATDEVLGRLALGTGHLSDALKGCNLAADGAAVALMSPGDDNALLFPDALQAGERFCYDDARGENSISLVAGPVTWARTFQIVGPKPVQRDAAPGDYFLLVAIRATHLGHKGDGVNTRIQTPAESAFALHYGSNTYRPIAAPGPTNKGGSYARTTLGRSESLSGYLFFEVPEDLDLSRAYLQANIGKDSPAWLLG